MLNVITDMVGFRSAILPFVFYLIFFFLFLYSFSLDSSCIN